jgi:hypothetical protein
MVAPPSIWQQLGTSPLRVGIGVVAALLVISLVTTAMPGEGTAPAAGARTSIGEIEASFRENEYAAKQAYEGTAIEVSSTVRAVRLGLNNNPEIDLYGASAELVGDSKAAATQLRAGQSITLRCAGASYILGSVSLNDCAIIALTGVPRDTSAAKDAA